MQGRGVTWFFSISPRAGVMWFRGRYNKGWIFKAPWAYVYPAEQLAPPPSYVRFLGFRWWRL